MEPVPLSLCSVLEHRGPPSINCLRQPEAIAGKHRIARCREEREKRVAKLSKMNLMIVELVLGHLVSQNQPDEKSVGHSEKLKKQL